MLFWWDKGHPRYSRVVLASDSLLLCWCLAAETVPELWVGKLGVGDSSLGKTLTLWNSR